MLAVVVGERNALLYLVTSADVVLFAVDVHAVGNVGRLLFDGDKQV